MPGPSGPARPATVLLRDLVRNRSLLDAPGTPQVRRQGHWWGRRAGGRRMAAPGLPTLVPRHTRARLSSQNGLFCLPPRRAKSQPWLRDPATRMMPRLSTRRWRKCECSPGRAQGCCRTPLLHSLNPQAHRSRLWILLFDQRRLGAAIASTGRRGQLAGGARRAISSGRRRGQELIRGHAGARTPRLQDGGDQRVLHRLERELREL